MSDRGPVLIERVLFNRRPQQIVKLLAAIAEPAGLRAGFERGARGRGRAVGAFHGADVPSKSIREWRARTAVDGVACNYFELWIPVPNTDLFRLEQAYFTLLRARISETNIDEELVAIHADPFDQSASPLCDYKQGPHLHIEIAPAPVPRCHFPLQLRNLREVLVSVEALTGALREALEIIRADLLSRCAR